MQTLDLARSEGVKSGVSIRTDLAEGLTLIEGDRVLLQQVMLNLVINAFEAMGVRGEGPHELRIATGKTASGGVIVSVQDSGLGVNPSDMERIFDAFYSTKPDGLGMGLSLCRAIVQAHGGKLWVSAGTAGGAIFQFTLPLGSGQGVRDMSVEAIAYLRAVETHHDLPPPPALAARIPPMGGRACADRGLPAIYARRVQCPGGNGPAYTWALPLQAQSP